MNRRQFIKAAAATAVSMVLPAASEAPVAFPHVMKAERVTVDSVVWYDLREMHRQELGKWFAEEMDKRVLKHLNEEVV